MNKEAFIIGLDYAIDYLEKLKLKIDDDNAHMFKLTTESSRKVDLVRSMPLQDPIGFEQKGPTVLSIVIEDHSNNGRLFL